MTYTTARNLKVGDVIREGRETYRIDDITTDEPATYWSGNKQRVVTEDQYCRLALTKISNGKRDGRYYHWTVMCVVEPAEVVV